MQLITRMVARHAASLISWHSPIKQENVKLGKVLLNKNMHSSSHSMFLLPFYRRFFPLLRLSLFLLVVSTKLICQGGWAPPESPHLPEGVRNHCIECLFALKKIAKKSKNK
jgi:hypothetical protein